MSQIGAKPEEHEVECLCGAKCRLRAGPFSWFYGCERYPECDGKVGAHPDGKPLGVVGTQADRDARKAAHAAASERQRIRNDR